MQVHYIVSASLELEILRGMTFSVSPERLNRHGKTHSHCEGLWSQTKFFFSFSTQSDFNTQHKTITRKDDIFLKKNNLTERKSLEQKHKIQSSFKQANGNSDRKYVIFTDVIQLLTILHVQKLHSQRDHLVHICFFL